MNGTSYALLNSHQRRGKLNSDFIFLNYIFLRCTNNGNIIEKRFMESN